MIEKIYYTAEELGIERKKATSAAHYFKIPLKIKKNGLLVHVKCKDRLINGARWVEEYAELNRQLKVNKYYVTMYNKKLKEVLKARENLHSAEKRVEEMIQKKDAIRRLI